MDTELKLKVIASNYGRDSGWLIESMSRPVAELYDCRCIEMFWDSYQMKGIDSSFDLSVLQDDLFWEHPEQLGIAFRSKQFTDIIMSDVICRWYGDEMRLGVRGLYARDVDLTIWEKISCLFRTRT